MSWGQECVAIM
jgi:hypothetical protein